MSKKILIVDDDDTLCQALKLKFSDRDYETVIASDGQEAIDALQSDTFDVVITDLHMPNKDGFAVLESIQQTQNANIPAYVITNLGSEEYCERAVGLGAKRCFVKSLVTLRDVVEIVDEGEA